MDYVASSSIGTSSKAIRVKRPRVKKEDKEI